MFGEEDWQEALLFGCVETVLAGPEDQEGRVGGGPATEALARVAEASRETVGEVGDAVGAEDEVSRAVWVAEGIGGLIGRVASDALWVDGEPAARGVQDVVVVQVAVQRLRRWGRVKERAGDPGGCGEVAVEAGAGQRGKRWLRGSRVASSGLAVWRVWMTSQRISVASSSRPLRTRSPREGPSCARTRTAATP